MEERLKPQPDLVSRFARDLDALVPPGAKVGIAVSGGPDSLALLLLAAAARPGGIEAATVDHALRAESRAEAERVGEVCARLGVRHAILAADWPQAPSSNLQARARELRYRLLGEWAQERELGAVATAHHLDDQAETVLMRLARGSGVGGLSGIEPRRSLGGSGDGQPMLVRPVLAWHRHELAGIVRSAGLAAVVDPANSDERFDRSRARALLEQTGWLDPSRLAAVASHCADADEALGFLSSREASRRISSEGESLKVDASDLPFEIQRRMLAEAIAALTGERPPGPDLVRALGSLVAGGTTTLAGLKLEGGKRWRLGPAPPRKGKAL